MKTVNSKVTRLKRLNYTYQAIGIMCVVGLLMFSLFSWIGLISMLSLITITALLLTFRSKVISVVVDIERKGILLEYYTKKTKLIDFKKVRYYVSENELSLYNKRKKVVTIEKDVWSNFKQLSDIVTTHLEKNNQRSNLSKVVKEILVEEALDYDSNNSNS